MVYVGRVCGILHVRFKEKIFDRKVCILHSSGPKLSWHDPIVPLPCGKDLLIPTLHEASSSIIVVAKDRKPRFTLEARCIVGVIDIFKLSLPLSQFLHNRGCRGPKTKVYP